MAESSRTLLKAALDALASNNPAEAIRCCKLILKNDRQNYDAFLVVGKALFASKQYDRADASYRRAVEINASGLRAWQGLAEVHEATGNISELITACEAAIQLCEKAGDVAHLVDYTRRLAVAYARASDHGKALKAWESLLVHPSTSEALHFEALCGVVDAKAGLMENYIQKECSSYLAEDKTLDAVSARHAAENDWASSEESLQLEELIRDMLKQPGHAEKYKSLLLQLLLCRLRARTAGEESRRLRLEITQICLSIVSQFVLDAAVTVLFGMCEEDNMDMIFDELDRPELAQGRISRLKLLGKKLFHFYPNQGPAMSAVALNMHQSASCSPSLARKRSWCEYALRMNENSIVGWQVLAELRAAEGAYSSGAECIRRGFQAIARFRSLYGMSMRFAELNLQLVLGDLLLKQGSYGEAAQAFEKILKDITDLKGLEVSKVFTAASEGKVKVLVAEGQTNEASRALSSLLAVDANNAWASAELGWLAFQNKDFKQALTYLEKAVDSRPQNASYQYRLGLSYWVSQDVLQCREKALNHLLESARLDSSRSEVFCILGHYYRDIHGGAHRAVRCYQKALLLNCEDEEAGEALCDLLEAGSQELLAIARCREASERSTRAYWAFRRLGYIQNNRKEWHNAVKNLQHAVRGYPNCADVWEALGVAYQQLGMLTAALKAYGRAIAIQGSGSLFALLQSGNILLTLGIYRKAVEMFSTALKKEPELLTGLFGMASALLGLARECSLMGAISWSSTLLKEASTFASKSAHITANIAAVWKLLGDIETTYARTLPWEYSFGDDVIANNSTQKHPILEKFQMSIESWNKRCLSAAMKAKHAYQHALHLQPWKSNLYADLCACLELVGNLDKDNPESASLALSKEAVACCGLALEGENVDLWTALGTVARNKGLRQHALIHALLVNGNHALAWAQLGHMYLSEGDEELAKEAFARARSADPTLALTWAAMSVMYIMQGSDKFEEAFASILYAVQLLPVRAYAYLFVSWEP